MLDREYCYLVYNFIMIFNVFWFNLLYLQKCIRCYYSMTIETMLSCLWMMFELYTANYKTLKIRKNFLTNYNSFDLLTYHKILMI